jgi:hypothetical protein
LSPARPDEHPTSGDAKACTTANAVPTVGRVPAQSALQVQASLELRQLETLAPTLMTLSGFNTVASTPRGLPVGLECELLALVDGVAIRVASHKMSVTFPYLELAAFEVGGRSSRTGRSSRGASRMIATSMGGAGADDCVLRLATAEHALVLRHCKHTQAQLARGVTPMMARWRQTTERRADATSRR